MNDGMWCALKMADRVGVEALDATLDFDWCALSPSDKIAPLHAIVNGVAKIDNASDKLLPVDTKELLSWMHGRGADPCAKAPASCEFEVALHAKGLTYCTDHYKSSIKVPCKNHTALSLAVAVRYAMKEDDLNNQRASFWRNAILRMEALISILKSQVSATKAAISPGTLQLWERLRGSAQGQDVTLLCGDGEVLAHAAVLCAASPVLRAMLGSSMREGDERRIELKDSPCEGASLFLDLLYAGTTYAQVETAALLEAIQLAHRWQVDHVTSMLEASLVAEISDASFGSIAKVAALLDLCALKAACVEFASTSDQVKRCLDGNRLPPIVAAMLNRKRGATSETDKSSKHRRIF